MQRSHLKSPKENDQFYSDDQLHDIGLIREVDGLVRVTVRRYHDEKDTKRFNWVTLDMSTYQERYAASTAV